VGGAGLWRRMIRKRGIAPATSRRKGGPRRPPWRCCGGCATGTTTFRRVGCRPRRRWSSWRKLSSFSGRWCRSFLRGPSERLAVRTEAAEGERGAGRSNRPRDLRGPRRSRCGTSCRRHSAGRLPSADEDDVRNGPDVAGRASEESGRMWALARTVARRLAAPWSGLVLLSLARGPPRRPTLGRTRTCRTGFPQDRTGWSP
jgi:hypothetical protein